MAPVLKCPDCGEKHPLASVPTHGAFPCRGCGRVLKVPTVVSQRAEGLPPATPEPPKSPAPRPVPVASGVARPAAARGAAPAAAPTATRAVPEVDQRALGALASPAIRRPVPRLGRVPWWMRFLLWIVAVPLSFLLVFLIARALSLFTTNQLSDLFLANNTGRFWPVARLLPVVALVTAGLVQSGVYVLARLRGRSRGGAHSSSDLSGSVSRPRGR
jgi:hypothetical protein